MIILIHSETDASTLVGNLGRAEYSYYFVRRAFHPVLERLGIVVPVHDPARDVRAIAANAEQHGESCVFVSFAAPHNTPLGLPCPTIPVFAWEFDTLPNEVWDDDPRNDWRFVLGRTGQAVTHSGFAVSATRSAMGPTYPVESIPAPVWDSHAALYRAQKDGPILPRGVSFGVTGRVIDTRTVDLSLYNSPTRRAYGFAPLPEHPASGTSLLRLDGVTFCTVFNPNDGRKNWLDMIGAFIWALRDQADATLVLKLTHREPDKAISAILETLCKLTPFLCRVVLIDGYLSDEDYRRLIEATTFTVNTSHGEGQCLPLMEFMSAGKPAVTPDHTAMADYITERNAFIVSSAPEPTAWPHDPRNAYRTLRQRLRFESLVSAYAEAFRVARRDPHRYAEMSAAAHQDMRAHCSEAEALRKLRPILSVPPVRDLSPRERQAVNGVVGL
ncbi:glycosyltransferase [Acetobacteraceae bacterium KSS8]|uniref:Glycosyltransferase n=1 Tax=Endosaccharibacter trunci TaxID=2812733 RepID=A0ABT1W8J8_9PROT|nr:glycosyltransferase [Acetobacteraceae bacterium KSS8]